MKFLLILTFLLYGCSRTVPLLKRGLSSDDRVFFVVQNGYGMNDQIRRGFIHGKVCIGMTSEHVFMLYGSPTRQYTILDEKTANSKEIWNYKEFINQEAVLLLEITFKLGKVIAIDGEYTDKCEKKF